jgi:hypothetical protein
MSKGSIGWITSETPRKKLENNKALRSAFKAQCLEILSYLRKETFTKRKPETLLKTPWKPMEIVPHDSKYTDQMVEILDELVSAWPKEKPILQVEFLKNETNNYDNHNRKKTQLILTLFT